MARRVQLKSKSDLAMALGQCKSALFGVVAFSAIINLLMLTGPLFMLQIYDRVLPSRSVPTLVGLVVLISALYLFQAIFEAIRSRVLNRVGSHLDESLAPRLYETTVQLPLRSHARDAAFQPLQDVDRIRAFLASGGPSALADLPWVPLYLLVCFLFHFAIGFAAVVGGVVLFVLTVLAERLTKEHAKAAAAYQGNRNVLLEASRRNAEVVRAMGMGRRLAARWWDINAHHLTSQQKGADVSGGLTSLSRAFRMLLQSGVLGLGAYLVIYQEATAGVIIASSILVSRALAPVEAAVSNWKAFVSSRQAWLRLGKLFALVPAEKTRLPLPSPEKALSVENVAASPPGGGRPVLHDVNLNLTAGQGLGIVGASAAGKSSLARILTGVWEPIHGKVRLDGAALDQWPPETLGAHIGYLPQDVELFEGTVAENIGRFENDLVASKVIAAAKSAGVHELILSLPDGYETAIGESGASLSAGQRQRVALARALYGDPFLVVLDEPNSNLDEEGERALTDAIAGVRRRGGIVIVIAHRPSALTAVDQILVLSGGRVLKLGPKVEVFRSALRPLEAAE